MVEKKELFTKDAILKYPPKMDPRKLTHIYTEKAAGKG